MADMLRDRPDPNGPQVFVPEKITNMGFASVSNGLPAIYFSGAEIQKLADNIGYAIVGKFSHSIPNSLQIQKALDCIKFSRAFTWKYINAKHILVQFEDMADYARLLSGPKGTPVWYIDRHPMRVFKWTPEFDAYCESPIAAIWCNLIGLPIHLYDQSALFAIGKLLGTPILVDRATADKTRLSFARICVEIDITKPPPEEIILDICGRETVQKVKWGKIPSYCRECNHVGHSSEVCYAAGRMERPERRDYNKVAPKQKQSGAQGGKGKQDQPHQNSRESEQIQRERNQGDGMARNQWRVAGTVDPGETRNPRAKGKGANTSEWTGPDITGGSPDPTGGEMEEFSGREGRNDLEAPGGSKNMDLDLDLAVTQKDCEPSSGARGYYTARRGTFHYARGGSRGAGRHAMGGGRENAADGNYMSTNQYYSLMANGDFDVDSCGEIEALEVAIQPPSGADAHNLISSEGGNELQVTEFQGGTSSSPGTNSPC